MFQFRNTDGGFHIDMAAQLTLIDEADEHLLAYFRSQPVDVDLFSVRILLREALMNAVIHGSGQDANKRVTLEVRLDREGITLIVQDGGSGFKRDQLPAAVDVLADGGRGMALMDIYADRVTLNSAGNRIELWKRFRSQAEQTTKLHSLHQG